MKISRQQLRKIIQEAFWSNKDIGSVEDVETVGDLRKLIASAQDAKRWEQTKGEAGEAVKGAIVDEILGKIPGASAAKSLFDFVKASYDLPDDARTGTALDHLDVDDDVAKIVDDPIENSFLDALGKKLESMDGEKRLEDLDMTSLLSDYIRAEFNSRTVSGFKEGKTMKITKTQLRRIIKEAYNSMSPTGKALANSIKGKFTRLYPDAKVGIDARGGFITVNGKKAVDMSQATGRGMTDEEMIEMMHTTYAETHVDDDVGTEARRGSRPGEHKLDFGKGTGTYNYRNEGAKVKITKTQLKKIIEEEFKASSKRSVNESANADEYYEEEVLDFAFSISQTFKQDQSQLFDAGLEPAQGRITREEWLQQLEVAGNQLRKVIERAVKKNIDSAISKFETQLHNGRFQR